MKTQNCNPKIKSFFEPGSYLFLEKESALYVSSSTLHALREQLTSHLDFRLVSEGASIGIDAIREGTRFLRTKPAMGQYKVLVMDNFHLATNEAQNAFLKTLEEPPDYAYIFLVTPYTDRLLKTIVSRAQIIENPKYKIPISKQIPNPKSQISNLIAMNIGERFLWLEGETKNITDKPKLKSKFLEIVNSFFDEMNELLKKDEISIEAVEYLREARWKIEQNFPNPKILVEGFFTLLP